jgi:phosphocarrier protein HPr
MKPTTTSSDHDNLAEMPDNKATRTVTITNPSGLHLRSAAAIAALVRGFQADVRLRKGPLDASAVDVLSMISLVVEPGDCLELEATGPQAEPALDELARFVANNFNENAAD